MGMTLLFQMVVKMRFEVEAMMGIELNKANVTSLGG